MKKLLLLSVLLAACTADLQTKKFECMEQNSAQACLQLVEKSSVEDAKIYHDKACKLGVATSCAFGK